jgi:protein ImuB
VRGLGYSAAAGIAPTREAAAVLAQIVASGKQIRSAPILQLSDLGSALDKLPLPSLSLEPQALKGLHAAGVRTVGELLVLPRAGLARRWGPQLTQYVQRLLGERPDPQPAHRAAPEYLRKFEFSEPVELVEGLLFPLRRLLQEFQGYLRGRDTAVQSLQLILQHPKPPHTTLELRTTQPQRDAQQMFALLREKLERKPLAGPVAQLLLDARQFTTTGNTQTGLFADSQTDGAAWATLLDKLCVRLGEAAVRQLTALDEHRPELAWQVVGEGAVVDAALPEGFPRRPLWLLEPQPLAAGAEQGLQISATPERIESGWWSGADIARDYYLVRLPDGGQGWIYRDLNGGRSNGHWYLHGIWA